MYYNVFFMRSSNMQKSLDDKKYSVEDHFRSLIGFKNYRWRILLQFSSINWFSSRISCDFQSLLVLILSTIYMYCSHFIIFRPKHFYTLSLFFIVRSKHLFLCCVFPMQCNVSFLQMLLSNLFLSFVDCSPQHLASIENQAIALFQFSNGTLLVTDIFNNEIPFVCDSSSVVWANNTKRI